MAVTFEITKDLIESGSNKQYTQQGLLAFGQIDRMMLVRVIGETDPQKVQPEVENYIKSLIPIGTPHFNDVLCTARYYSVQPAQSDTIVPAIVSYVYNQIPVDATIWTIESNGYAEILDTDVEYDDSGNAIPIQVSNYVLAKKTPTDFFGVSPLGIPEPPAFGIVPAFKPRKRWIYTKQIYSKIDAKTFDSATVNYVGCLNSTTYTGTSLGAVSQGLSCAPGTVLCLDAGVSFTPYSGTYIARAELVYKPEGWDPWVRWASSYLPNPDNIWRGTPDIPSVSYVANGTKRVRPNLRADLNALMALI
jgi:hypothetical protein